MQNQDFQSIPEYDTIDTNLFDLEDEMFRESLYHTHYAIYLFCAVESSIADAICNGNKNAFPLPLKLYETSRIAKQMAVNIHQPKILKVAVNLYIENPACYYDELTFDDTTVTKLKEFLKCKTMQEVENKCLYTRKIINLKDKKKVIEYTINSRICLMDVQCASIN